MAIPFKALSCGVFLFEFTILLLGEEGGRCTIFVLLLLPLTILINLFYYPVVIDSNDDSHYY